MQVKFLAAERNSVVYEILRAASVLTYYLFRTYLLIGGVAKNKTVAK